ncbi:MAG: DUF1330 domain-containing protein [Gammaproteobacteria bacterium]|nr:DUF1330 domain-containing protein [Gammaproteobacteria bacterium]
MSVYVIAQIQIHDRDKYSEYEAGFMEIFASYNGKLLSVEESPQVLEGDWSFTRTVLLQFPTGEEAGAWYYSDEYQALAQHRFAASGANIALINAL